MTEKQVAQVRTKIVEMDGAQFVIAPLTLDQIEQYVKLDTLSKNKSVGFTKAYEVICYGLNNALPEGTPEEQLWTPEKIKANIDLVMFELLQKEIIDFSGFKLQSGAAVAVAGELGAALEEGKSQPKEAIS